MLIFPLEKNIYKYNMNIKNTKYTKYKNTKLFYVQLNDIKI